MPASAAKQKRKSISDLGTRRQKSAQLQIALSLKQTLSRIFGLFFRLRFSYKAALFSQRSNNNGQTKWKAARVDISTRSHIKDTCSKKNTCG
jgi:hypothetical protein